jgi:hypothetical protein
MICCTTMATFNVSLLVELGARTDRSVLYQWLVSQKNAGIVFVNCCCEKLVAEARGQFGDPVEGERPSLEATTKQRQWRRDCGH